MVQHKNTLYVRISNYYVFFFLIIFPESVNMFLEKKANFCVDEKNLWQKKNAQWNALCGVCFDKINFMEIYFRQWKKNKRFFSHLRILLRSMCGMIYFKQEIKKIKNYICTCFKIDTYQNMNLCENPMRQVTAFAMKVTIGSMY